jgi:hypothetical protein
MKPRKRKKVIKSLAGLSSDSTGATDASPETTKPPQPNLPAENQTKKLAADFPKFSDAQGFHDWGINE